MRAYLCFSYYIYSYTWTPAISQKASLNADGLLSTKSVDDVDEDSTRYQKGGKTTTHRCSYPGSHPDR